MKTVSVIVPIYNAKSTIKKCLDSLIGQTYKDLEIILIDDGSNDGCEKICDSYMKNDSRIKVIHKDNEGVSIARNEGLKVATGEYIQFVDSDDYIKDTMIERLVNYSEERDADIVICGYNIINESPQVPKKIGEFSKEDMFNIIFDKDRYIYTNPPWNRLIRSKIIKENNITFDKNISKGEDYMFNIDVFNKCNKYLIVEDCLYNYNQGENGLCKKKRELDFFWNNSKILWNKLKEFYINNNIYERYKEKLNSEYIELLKENVNVLIREYKEEIKQNKIKIIKKSFEDAKIDDVISKYDKSKKSEIVVKCIQLNKPQYLYYMLKVINKIKKN